MEVPTVQAMARVCLFCIDIASGYDIHRASHGRAMAHLSK